MLMSMEKNNISIGKSFAINNTPIKTNEKIETSDNEELDSDIFIIDDNFIEISGIAASTNKKDYNYYPSKDYVKSVNGHTGHVIVETGGMDEDKLQRWLNEHKYVTETNENLVNYYTKLQTEEIVEEDVFAALEEAKESGEFKGDKGDPGEPGPQGPQGEDGDPGTLVYVGASTPTDPAELWFNIGDNSPITIATYAEVQQMIFDAIGYVINNEYFGN